MPWKWYDSHVMHIEQAGPDTKRFFLEVDTAEPFAFEPGQFITADLPIHEKRTKRWRSYSIANAPNQSNTIELCVVHLQDGAASKYLFEEVGVGTHLRFKGPSGGFVLPGDKDHEMIMICTGTGIAPFRSMLLAMQSDPSLQRPVHLIFGTRYEEGILYKDELEQLAVDADYFQYSIALSRSTTWSGYQGYVHQIYEDLYARPVTDRIFYLCGWSMMVDEAVERLLGLGYDRMQIRFELYG